eukprot:5573470-Pleurochrysis_carterae.AAC.3
MPPARATGIRVAWANAQSRFSERVPVCCLEFHSKSAVSLNYTRRRAHADTAASARAAATPKRTRAHQHAARPMRATVCPRVPPCARACSPMPGALHAHAPAARRARL